MDSFAAYVSGDWHPTERLGVNAGARYSRFDINLAATPDSPGTGLVPGNISGGVHLNYSLSSTLNLMTNLGRGFRAPNIFDLGTLGERPGNRFNIANPGLGPETVRNYDLGIKHGKEIEKQQQAREGDQGRQLNGEALAGIEHG